MTSSTALRLNDALSYRTCSGQEYTQTPAPALMHLFNHQTRHRGQVTTLLTQMGIDLGVTDLAVFHREGH